MQRNVRLMVLAILALFLIPLVLVNADPLERFAENPIPYWEDDSIDVNVTWSEAEQTVDFDLGYWENEFENTDGWSINYANLVPPADRNFEITDYYGNFSIICDEEGEEVVGWQLTVDADEGDIFQVRYKTILGQIRFRIAGVYLAGFEQSAEWVVVEHSVITGGTLLVIYLSDRNLLDDDTIFLHIDYVRLIPSGILDIGVPLEPGITQSVEFMGNFSALNSTVRFEMYDNTTASGLFCDVNSTQVTFPGAGDNGLSYAVFSDIARINFSLDEKRIIFKIYVFAQNMTLINCYSDYVGLANNDYLRMNDSMFDGSYELWYLQGDLGYLAEVIDTDNIFYLLFLSTEMWGYLGPLALVVMGFVLTQKHKELGILMFIVDSLLIVQYLALIEATPDYWWHIIILLIGVIQCTIQLMSRR